jgi:cellulose synthase/poly-beta-1,6-N-acetylglucosamine synthase-like glycosyltransferase
MLIIELLFWISIFALVHSYLIFPITIAIFARYKKNNLYVYTEIDEWPTITIIMAVRNAEKILEKKIKSIYASNYPPQKISLLVGSDASDDSTNQIIEGLAKQFSSIQFYAFVARTGKVEIINFLARQAQTAILVFTDAYAVFEQGSLKQLVKHFKNPDIHVVGGKMKGDVSLSGNVSVQELSYFETEYKIKYAEGKLWGCMMGAFGAFYAVRRNNWHPVPDNFLNDDFYISIKAIETRGKAIFEPEAIVCQNVSGNPKEEFRRKIRIATGNFQNFKAISPLLFQKKFGFVFSLLSHKILRWFGPIFLLIAFFCLFTLFYKNLTYHILFIIMLLSLLIPITDFLLEKIRIHVVHLRFIKHFYFMNIALLIGMFRFMKGVKSNVWEPTKRN